jgi:hypothetical protein
LVNAEDAFRNRYTATEALLWAELVTTFESHPGDDGIS